MELDNIIKHAIDKANKDNKPFIIERKLSRLMKEYGPYLPFNTLTVKPNATYKQVASQAKEIGWL